MRPTGEQDEAYMKKSTLQANQSLVLQMLRRLAAQGDGEALFNLGYMQMRGIEVEQNTTAAYMLFTAVGFTALDDALKATVCQPLLH